MNLFGMLEVSGSAMTAERWRAEVVASNMANAETTRTPGGGAYRRQLVVFRARPASRFPLLLAGLHSQAGAGVRLDRVVADPNVNPVLEMTDLLSAVRAYQLNAAAVQATKNMIQQSLQILS